MHSLKKIELPNFSWFLSNFFDLKNQHIFLFFVIFSIASGSIEGIPLNINQWITILWMIYQILFIRDRKNINYYLIILIFIYISVLLHNEYFSMEMLKKIMGVGVLSITSYKYVFHHRNRLEDIFSIFIYISIIIASIAIIQQIGWFFQITWLYDFKYLGINNYVHFIGSVFRSTSVASEAAHLAYMLVPSFFVAFGSLLTKKTPFHLSFYKRWIIILGMVFSFSVIGYFSMFVCIAYLFIYGKIKLFKKIYISILVAPVIILVVAFNAGNVASRITRMATTNFEVTSSTLSQWGLISNLYVAYSSLVNNPLGTGIQTHEYNYDKYFSNLSFLGTIRINEIDANSLILRIISEFGLIGIIILISFYFVFRIKNQKYPYELYMFLNTIAFLFIYLYAIRNGAYLDPLLWYFISIAFLSKKISNA